MSPTQPRVPVSSHVEKPAAKRKRSNSPAVNTGAADGDGTVPHEYEASVPFRLVTLQIGIRSRTSDNRERVPMAMLFVPEQIMKMIPKYQSELQRVMEDQRPNANLRITDSILRYAYEIASLADVIQILGGASVSEIRCTSLQDPYCFSHLVLMYDMSVELGIKSTEMAILAYIEDCDEMSTDNLLELAKRVYNDGGQYRTMSSHEVDTSICQMIRRKLSTFLPDMLMEGTVQKTHSGGGTLSKELLQVMIGALEDKQSIKVESANQLDQ